MKMGNYQDVKTYWIKTKIGNRELSTSLITNFYSCKN